MNLKNIIIISFIITVIICMFTIFLALKNNSIATSETFEYIDEILELTETETNSIAENETTNTFIEETENLENETYFVNDSAPSSTGKPYYIMVNYTENVVNIYELDDNNKYSIPVKAMVCSTGTSTPTSGKYRIGMKARWLSLFGGVYGQYATQVVGNILFHSVPYLKNYNPASLEYWEYDKLGTSASMGCIRLTVIDAKWIYDNIDIGTTVEFYSDSNPGPFGKPIAEKISENEEKRNWDPTDPDEDNVWNY